MSANNPQDLGLLAKLVLIVAVLLLAVGTLWHGVTLAVLHRIWNNLINRPSEPIALQLAFLPYVFMRGPVARIARWRTRASRAEQIRG
jgi:hypothetical protein